MLRFPTFLRHILPAGASLLVLAGMLAGCASHPTRDDYVVFFDTESVKLGQTGRAILANAVEAARKRHISQITVSGSAGKIGDEDVLKKLADTRAEKVITLLEKDGFPGAGIHKIPFVPASFEDSHVAFRRVTIHLGAR